MRKNVSAATDAKVYQLVILKRVKRNRKKKIYLRPSFPRSRTIQKAPAWRKKAGERLRVVIRCVVDRKRGNKRSTQEERKPVTSWMKRFGVGNSWEK